MAKSNGSQFKGMYSTKTNPKPQPSRVPREFGPSSNADSQKANKLLKKAYAENDSLRGKMGM